MSWQQQTLRLRPRPRGIHLITDEVRQALVDLEQLRIGLLHVFIRHSSAALAINENADGDVRLDLAAWFDRSVRENERWYRHTCEGPDDMPAHIKAVLAGSSVTVPISAGHLALGTWQGIYLCEFRDLGGSRELVLTVQGTT